MSSLMVSNLEIMMLEFAIDKLFVPKTSIFDSVIMKKTTVMFRMLDNNWTGLNPHRKDYAPYRGSNLEEEDFHGGKSIVFAIPGESLEEKVNGIDIQIHVRKEVSKYFEMEPCQNVGIAMVSMDNLFNGIIRELRERKELEGYLTGCHKRQPISRSLKGTYEIIGEDLRISGAKITLYVRLSHFGKSVITEIEPGSGRRREFYVQEETNQALPYHCKELSISKLEAGYWGSEKVSPPVKPNELQCHCDTWEPLDESDVKSLDSETDTGQSHAGHADGQQPEDSKGQRTSGQSDRSRGSRENRGSQESRSSRDSRGKTKKKGKRRSKGDRVSGSSDDVKKSRKPGPRSRTNKRLKTSKSEGTRNSIESLEERGDRKVADGASKSQDAGDGTKESSNEDADRKDRPGQSDAEMAGEDDGPGGAAAKRLLRSGAGRNRKRKRDDSRDGKMGDKSSKEEVNRRVQARKRPRGLITVGLREKEEKICIETSTTLLPLCRMSAPIEPTICTNYLRSFSFCCHRSFPGCKPDTFLAGNCSMDTATNSPWHQPIFGTSNFFFPPDTGICTN